jgi:AP-1 complex subunit beta-1
VSITSQLPPLSAREDTAWTKCRSGESSKPIPASASSEPAADRSPSSFEEADTSTQKALETVVAGQKSENLLDFDTDEPSIADTSIGTNTVPASFAPSSAAIASVAAAKNPLDELMDLFSNSNLQAPSNAPVMSVTSPTNQSVNAAAAASSPFDFDGLAGFGGPNTAGSSNKPAGAPKTQSEDLLGLF